MSVLARAVLGLSLLGSVGCSKKAEIGEDPSAKPTASQTSVASASAPPSASVDEAKAPGGKSKVVKMIETGTDIKGPRSL